MNKKEFIDTIYKNLKYKTISKDILEELECHIDDAIDLYIDNGMNEEEAEEKAISDMGNPQKIVDRINKIHRPKTDFKALLFCGMLLIFGFLVAFIRANLNPDGIEQTSVYRYIIYLVMGLIISKIIYSINYLKFMKHSNICYILATLMLLYTLFCGVEKDGGLFIYTPIITFNPIVMVIPLYVIAFVGNIEKIINIKYDKVMMYHIRHKNKKEDTKIGKTYEEIKKEKVKLQFKIIFVLFLNFISVYLLLKTSSLISAGILGLIYLIIFTIKLNDLKERKLSFKVNGHITIMWISSLIVFIIYVLMNTFINYNDISLNTLKKAYNDQIIEKNQEIIINSLNLYGNLDENNRKIQNNPGVQDKIDEIEEGTSYAYSVILIKYGWLITALMSLTIFALCVKMILDAIKVKEQYGKLLIVGIASMFIIEYVTNILMNLNLGVKVNLGLPFISWGSISLITHMMCLSFILSIYRRKDIISIQDNI